MKNLIAKFKNFMYRLYSVSYGMDDLNRYLIITSLVFSVVNLFVKNNIIYYLSMFFSLLFIFRFFSRKKYARSEENRKVRKLIKYYTLKWNNRKTHRVFKCKKCGQFIRVPKGKGKIETTCPSCGNKETHRS